MSSYYSPGDAGNRNLVTMVRIAAFGAMLLTIGSLFGTAHWLLELLTHFRVQYAVGSILLAAVAIALQCRASSLVLVLVAVTNLVPAWGYTIPGAPEVRAGTLAFKIMSLNVGLRNSDYEATLALVEREAPDVVGFLEVDQAWVDGLQKLQAVYPHSILRPEEGSYGLALFSRLPLRELDGSPYVEGGIQTAVSASVEVQFQEVFVMLAHLMAPTSRNNAALRNIQIETMVGMLQEQGTENRILIGDLNITPWSPYYTQLEDEAGLRNAAKSRGFMPTWWAGIHPLKIPIDHCLVSDHLEIQQFRRGNDVGSDHLPIIADIAVTDFAPDSSGMTP